MCLSTAEEKINVVILYDKHAAGLQAMALHAQLTRDLASECAPDLSLWRCDMAIAPELAPKASCDLAEADLVVVAVHGHEPRPELLSGESNDMEQPYSTPRRLLVVLLEFDGEPTPAGRAWSDLLRPVAARRQTTFFTWGAHAGERGAAGLMREVTSLGVAEPELAGAAPGEN